HPVALGHVDVADMPDLGEKIHSKSEIAHSEHLETHDLHAAADVAPHSPHSASNPADPAPDHPHHVAAGHVDVADMPDRENSFHFKSAIPQHPDAPAPPKGAHAQASIGHDDDLPGPNGLAVDMADLSPAQPHDAKHAAAVDQHADHVAAVHAAHAHDL